MPPAELEARPTDVPFTYEALEQISLLKDLKRKPSLDRFPGTLAVRRYERGEVICRQGENGWTAFYGLTDADVCALQKAQLEAQLRTAQEAKEKNALQAELALLRQRAAERQAKGPDAEPPRLATAYLSVAAPTPAPRTGWLERLVRWSSGDPGRPDEPPETIRIIDAPRDVDYQTMQASIHEKDLFGEMTCRHGTPWPTTIVADRDCYFLEMLRNILDQITKDPAYKARLDERYKQQVFQLHLRRLSLFADLSDEQFDRLRGQLELQTFEPGEVIYDEHELPDALYIIRSGLVRVVKKVSALLSDDDVRDWKRLGARLLEGEVMPADPAGKVWALLSEEARAAGRAAAGARPLSRPQRWTLLKGLNEIIRSQQTPDLKELEAIVKEPRFKERTQDFPLNRKAWADQDYRRYNRMLLDSIFGLSLREYYRRVGRDYVLYYCARGEFIGEAGLLTDQLHGETCIAHSHPLDAGTAKEAVPAEVVRIPRAAFAEMLAASDGLRRKVKRKLAEREKQTQKSLSDPPWDDSRQILHSKRFEELGLIQGQRLMLIDLSRCTRCDECVRACVATHADGHSRLYLDGPRLGNYLVPTTCRSCLDPVCMIGCPVGSIHKGNNGQIVIEDWCIGCGLCANNCPYGSIRMDDIGIIPEGARGWRSAPLSAVRDGGWMLPGYKDRDWLTGVGPFRNTRDFRESLRPLLPRKSTPAGGDAVLSAVVPEDIFRIMKQYPEAVSTKIGQLVCFRYEFTLAGETLRGNSNLKLEVTSPDPDLCVWVNGQDVQPADKPRGGKREYWFPPRAVPAAPPSPAPMLLRAGSNLLAIRVNPESGSDSAFLRVRLDEVRKPKVAAGAAEEVTQKPVLSRAVVCDLCSAQLGQVPACVNACPHDAAMRIDARSEFPDL
jgi:Fe-S-cluster-containing hydrogenase component 2